MTAGCRPVEWWTAGVCGLVAITACGSKGTPPLAVRNALADSADQVLYHTKSVLTDNGVMKAEIHSDTAYLFDDNTRIEMRIVETIFFTATGAKNATLNSREGTYNTRSNNMEARGNVVVVSEDGRVLKTQELRYSQNRSEITSDSAFVLNDSTQVMNGIGFVSDPSMNNVRCLKACSGSAGMVTLPGAPGDTARVAPPPHRATPAARTGGALPPSAGLGTPGTPGGATITQPITQPTSPGASGPPPPHNGGAIGVNPTAAGSSGRPAATSPAPAAAPPASAPPASSTPATPDTLHHKAPAAPATPPSGGATATGQGPP
jgi:LPS export ABC transporter protein LptC